MIRKLNYNDNDQLIEYLTEEKAINLFILGDIENFGYDKEFQEIWAEFDDMDEIKAVLLRYFNSYVAYAKGEFSVKDFAEILNNNPNFEILSGIDKVVETLAKYINYKNKKSLYYSELDNDLQLAKDFDRSNIIQANLTDVDSIFELRKQIIEFTTTKASKISFKQTLASGTGRTYMIKDNNKVICTVSTTAENSFSVMVVGVSTHPEYRMKGYASLCMTALCKDILDEGKTLCLFYDNPDAGKIYKRLGFRDIGKWSMLYSNNVKE